MSRLQRLVLNPVFLVGLFAILIMFIRSGRLHDLAPWRNARAEQTHPLSDNLERRAAAALCRVKAKKRLAKQVIEQRLTLLEAAGLFRDLAEADPFYRRELLALFFPGSSDDERYCRQVIAAVKAQEGELPDQACRASELLEKELRAHLDRSTLKLSP